MECEVRHTLVPLRQPKRRLPVVLLMTLLTCTYVINTEAMMSQPTSPCQARGCECTGKGAFCQCDNSVQTISLTGEHTSYIGTLSIRGCQHVHIAEDTLRNLTMLSKVEIHNVKELVLAPRSLHGGHWHKNLAISITNTTVENLSSYVFQGNISEISIRQSHIRQIGAYAFSSLTAPALYVSITDSTIDRIAQQAFKRISLTTFSLKRTEITEDVPSKILSEVEITESFGISDSKFKTVRSSAFNVQQPRIVEIVNSRFDVLEGDAFAIAARGQVLFRNNSIGELHKGAFAGITVTKDILNVYGAQDFIFDNNTITSFVKGSLWTNATSLKPRFNHVRLDEKCSCKIVERILINSAPFYCSIEPSFNQKQTQGPDHQQQNRYESLDRILALECRDHGYNSWYIWVILFICLLVLVAGGGLMIWLCKRHRNRNRKKWINNSGSDEKNPNIIMPEPKTYRETEVHVIVERAELLTTDL